MREEPGSTPRLPALFARAALTVRGRGGDLPTTRPSRTGVTADPAEVAAYARVCGFPLADALPPMYPQVLAFPLQVALMSDRSFPLALPGLVQVRNRTTVLRPVALGEALDLEVWAERLARHPRGATVDLCAAVSAAGTEVWRGRSTYLARGASAPEGAPRADVDVTVGPLPEGSIRWLVADDAGRRYATVSGDLNPVHLSGLTAKAFGFKRAIAHGAWVQARALATLSGRLPGALTVDAAFRRPILLPSTVTLATAPVDGGWDLAVRNAATGADHLVGTVRPL